MGHKIQLTAADGHVISAYLAEPGGKPRGGIVVTQEIFGVTRHIRDVTEQYAAAGYLAVAPACPRGIYHLYPAGHGFNCTDRPSFDAQCAKLAFDRSVEFFHQNIG
jgi:dienelactone hydrolase